MYSLGQIQKTIFPDQCLLCRQIVNPGQWCCRYCRASLPYIEHACAVCGLVMPYNGRCGQCLRRRPYFDHSLSVFRFVDPISSYIYQFKYQHRFYLGRILAEELLQVIRRSPLPYPDLITAVPLHRKRLIQRGFNQSALVAAHIAKKLKIPFKNNYLIRHRYARPQTGMNATQRRIAVLNAFAINREQAYDHIALVDDVVTTTHTVNQASKALKIHGTNRISVWSVARNT